MVLIFPLMKRKRLRKVEQVQLMPPYESEGRDTSMASPFFTKLSSEDLKRENSELWPGSEVSAAKRSARRGVALREAFAKRI
jgi:hypothetical protein